MSNQFEQIKRDIMSAMRSNKPRTEAYDTTAEVLYEDDDALWVRIPGGVGETPVEKSIAAKTGDIVQVRVANGRAWINGNNTAPPTDDTVAIKAHTVATETHEAVEELEEHFWYDGSGAHVEGESYRNDMRSDGLHIVEKSTGETVARFGAGGSQIGKEGESHVITDYHSLRMIDADGNVYFEIQDLRNQSGQAVFVDSYTGDGSNRFFVLSDAYIRYNATLQSVTVNGVVKTQGTDYAIALTPSSATIGFMTAPANGAVIEATYYTTTPLRAFTFGTRKTDSFVAPDSFSAGNNNDASGSDSFAEGNGNTASGFASHVEGSGCTAAGGMSHAQNIGTIANGVNQTVVGRHNVPDPATPNDMATPTYAFIVGNGTSNTSRSNALGIKWNGDYEFQTDGDLATALTAKGWNVAGTGGLVSLKKILTEIINAL